MKGYDLPQHLTCQKSWLQLTPDCDHSIFFPSFCVQEGTNCSCHQVLTKFTLSFLDKNCSSSPRRCCRGRNFYDKKLCSDITIMSVEMCLKLLPNNQSSTCLMCIVRLTIQYWYTPIIIAHRTKPSMFLIRFNWCLMYSLLSFILNTLVIWVRAVENHIPNRNSLETTSHH